MSWRTLTYHNGIDQDCRYRLEIDETGNGTFYAGGWLLKYMENGSGDDRWIEQEFDISPETASGIIDALEEEGSEHREFHGPPEGFRFVELGPEEEISTEGEIPDSAVLYGHMGFLERTARELLEEHTGHTDRYSPFR